ncbi:hypothetical protein C8A03DRAFT_15056 [Achaetomium macrosporum]|uniref:Uncharacterized protein n=1 Tax=Achaetomium macrosporum TaxID=79813 RepID=A0AAN7HFN4_9PEZI|nr:hypothetical protein C8A03DRAFT_15056 [Achaetomium macrosporum]
MAFIQDPRLRQRWNQISHTTEAVTENAAAEIWTFGHRYINPCLASLAAAVDSCTSVCLGGDREERARRARERDRGARRSRARTQAPEYSFDFYDDWEEDLDFEDGFPGYDDDYDDGVLGGGGGSSSGGGGGGLNWDRLLAGTGSGNRGRAHGVGGDVTVDQPKRKRGMSYGTRGGVRRKVSGEEDPNVIPRTAPLGFLGRLPFKIVGSLRYKPSAANLKEHPAGGGTAQQYRASGGGGEEHEPLLGTSDEGDGGRYQKGSPRQRPRSDTTLSGDTSSSYRSRGDLFPSDGEGDEDAVPLDDEFTMALERVDDRGSTKTRSSKGKRPADRERARDKGLSRTLSRTTLSSTTTRDDSRSESNAVSPSREVEDAIPVLSLEDLQREEEEAEREEHQEIERRRRTASRLAVERGLSQQDDTPGTLETVEETTIGSLVEGAPPEEPMPKANGTATDNGEAVRVELKPPTTAPPEPTQTDKTNGQPRKESTFVPARLPRFG